MCQEERASLAEQNSTLLDAKEAGQQRIRELEEDIKTQSQRAEEREMELDR